MAKFPQTEDGYRTVMVVGLLNILKNNLETDLKSGLLKMEKYASISIEVASSVDLSVYIVNSVNAWILVNEQRGNENKSNINKILAILKNIIGEHHEVFDYFELDVSERFLTKN